LAELETGTYGGHAVERTTVAHLLDSLLKDFEVNGKSVAWAKIVDAHLRPFFGHLRAKRVDTVTLEEYIERRHLEGMSNATVNRELGWLRRAFNLGAQSVPPRCRPLPYMKKLKEAPPRKGFFEYEEFTKLRSELPEHLRPVITFGYYSGCRRGEILGLRWEQVDFAAKVVRLEPGETKNDEARTIPLIGELPEMLAMLKAQRDERWPRCHHVFSRWGKPIKSFIDAWYEACKRAGMVDISGKPSRLFHDLRRTGVRNLVRAGVPERVAMLISGHKTRSVFDRYSIVSQRDLQDAAARLERHLEELESARDKDQTRTIEGRATKHHQAGSGASDSKLLQ
jgi:integrase